MHYSNLDHLLQANYEYSLFTEKLTISSFDEHLNRLSTIDLQ
jgi:hypothetical protein